jgi:hypothetical protein
MSTKQSALDRLVYRVNEMDITEQINWLGDAIMSVEARRELAEVRAENDALRMRVAELENKGGALFQACSDLCLPDMNKLEREINDFSAALKGGEK